MIAIALYFMLFLVWGGVAIVFWIGLSDLPKSERAAGDWIIFGLWPIAIPLLMLYDLWTWARRKWAVRNRNHG